MTVRPIHYLGSKLRMLQAIKDSLDMVDTANGTVCDLFCGSGTVSEYLLNYRDVISVDIQNYSKVLCTANMTSCKYKDAPSVIKEIQDTDIFGIFSPLIQYERDCLKSEDIAPLYEIIENGSLYIYQHGETPNLSAGLEEAIHGTFSLLQKAGKENSVDTMITRYFGGIYFSYEQAVQMDAIEKYVFLHDGIVRDKLLAALLSTASEIVNTVGKQFAQPLKVRNSQGKLKKSLRTKILKDRSLNVWEYYAKWLNYYFSICPPKHSYEAVCMDYADALDFLRGRQIAAIYADPPYTRYHYSRYYHVLETMCLHDNPDVSTTFPNGKGGISRAVYRKDRHQSPFCIKSKAEGAFRTLFAKASRLDVPLVLSYSPYDSSKSAVTPRLQTIEQLIDLAKEYYDHISIASPGHFVHSKLNSTENNFDDASHEAERLIICRKDGIDDSH